MPSTRTRRELAQLTAIFLSWKMFLLVIAYTSSSPGYDTSTSLLGPTPSTLALKLTRWDAIYFTTVAQRDYLFEQEWAFGWGCTRIFKAIAQFLESSSATDLPAFPLAEAYTGILISHIGHFISVLALYDMSRTIFAARNPAGAITSMPYGASILHIFTPGGLFLSAPNPEGLFSGLAFTGYALFVRASVRPQSAPSRSVLLFSSAVLFGLATTVRTNGLLNGLLFLSEALRACNGILKDGLSAGGLVDLAVICLCGGIVGLGNVIPQLIAYRTFCLDGGEAVRPWCKNTLPSIYNFVQSHYWNTGLFKYWTLSNLPLFIIAAPSLALFYKSSIWAWKRDSMKDDRWERSIDPKTRGMLRILALPQMALLLLVLTTYHTQIIIRLSSGYPVWYWWLTRSLSSPKDGALARSSIKWMILQAAIQGALFANFLPPA